MRAFEWNFSSKIESLIICRNYNRDAIKWHLFDEKRNFTHTQSRNLTLIGQSIGRIEKNNPVSFNLLKDFPFLSFFGRKKRSNIGDWAYNSFNFYNMCLCAEFFSHQTVWILILKTKCSSQLRIFLVEGVFFFLLAQEKGKKTQSIVLVHWSMAIIIITKRECLFNVHIYFWPQS